MLGIHASIGPSSQHQLRLARNSNQHLRSAIGKTLGYSTMSLHFFLQFFFWEPSLFNLRLARVACRNMECTTFRYPSVFLFGPLLASARWSQGRGTCLTHEPSLFTFIFWIVSRPKQRPYTWRVILPWLLSQPIVTLRYGYEQRRLWLLLLAATAVSVGVSRSLSTWWSVDVGLWEETTFDFNTLASTLFACGDVG